MKISNRLMDRLIHNFLPITSPKKIQWLGTRKKPYCNHLLREEKKDAFIEMFCNMARSVMENCFVAKEVVMTPLPLKLPGYLRGRSLSTIGPSYFIKEWI